MLPGERLDLVAAAFLDRPAWMADAHCTNLAVGFVPAPGRANKPPSQAEQAAIAVCRACPVREECLDYALEHGELGMWGGTTERQRAALGNQAHSA